MTFVPGMLGPGALVVPFVPPLSVSAVSETTSASTTIAWPAVQAGDVAVLFDGGVSTFGSGTPSNVTPTNFTSLRSMSVTNLAAMNISYKLCTGSESGSITGIATGGATTVAARKVLFIFRGNKTITSVTADGWAGEFIAGDPSQIDTNADTGTAPLAVFGCVFQTSAAFTAQSPTFDDTGTRSGDSIVLTAGYKIYNSGPADHSLDCADTGTYNGLAAGWLEFI